MAAHIVVRLTAGIWNENDGFRRRSSDDRGRRTSTVADTPSFLLTDGQLGSRAEAPSPSAGHSAEMDGLSTTGVSWSCSAGAVCATMAAEFGAWSPPSAMDGTRACVSAAS